MNRTVLFLTVLLLLQSCAGIQKAPPHEKNSTKTASIIMTGDVMIARKLAPIALLHGIDYPFENISDEFNRSEIVFGNLEEPLIYEKNVANIEQNGKKEVYLYDTEKTADGLKNVGFNIVSLANNHILDYGQYGLTQTVKILESRGLNYCGLWTDKQEGPNRPCMMKAGGAKVGFLCYSQVSDKQFAAANGRTGTIPGIRQIIVSDIKSCRKDADIIIVYLHWGREYMPVDGKQKYMAHRLIDAGADMVIGSHTHIFLDIEKYRGKYIFYGLGNFIFDLEREATKYSGYLKASIVNKHIGRVTLTPVYLKEYRPVVVQDADEKLKFINSIKFINLRPEEIAE
jgi:poly-gamma-glutamate synthesis protein (capsule biosynthesis protein)